MQRNWQNRQPGGRVPFPSGGGRRPLLEWSESTPGVLRGVGAAHRKHESFGGRCPPHATSPGKATEEKSTFLPTERSGIARRRLSLPPKNTFLPNEPSGVGCPRL